MDPINEKLNLLIYEYGGYICHIGEGDLVLDGQFSIEELKKIISIVEEGK